MNQKQVMISLFFLSVLTLFLPLLWQLPILLALYFIWTPYQRRLFVYIPLSYMVVSFLTNTGGVTMGLNVVLLFLSFYLLRHCSLTPIANSICYMGMSLMMTSITPSIVGLCKHTLYMRQLLSYSANLIMHSLAITLVMTLIIWGSHKKKEASR